VMSDKGEQTRQFEQVMATIFTCRSVVKYNSILSEEQKKELIADIDATLPFLRGRLAANEVTSGEKASTQSPATEMHSAIPLKENHTDKEPDQQALQALYRMYHTYMGLQQQNNLSTFVTRFNDVMSAMNQLQDIVGRYQDEYVSVGQPIERVSSFIADLYYIFVEFIRVLSQILEENDVHLDTEEVAVMQSCYLDHDERLRGLRTLAPVIKVFEAHQRLNAWKGAVSSRVNGTMVFLEFLEECLVSDFHKRDEVVTQLNTAMALLRDVSHLLGDYELAMSVLLKRK